MLSNSLKRLNSVNPRLISVDDISDDLVVGRSAAHTAFWKYFQVGSFDAALEYAEQIIGREPEKPDGYVFKGRALSKKGRHQEAEEVLLKVMKIAEDNDLIRNDIDGMVKLKDELANSRVEILRSRNFREPLDIAEMHWNDCKKTILELIGFSKPRVGGGGDQSTPMDIDSIIDIIGPEKAKQLYPDLRLDSTPLHMSHSTPNSSNGFSKRRSDGFSNLNLSANFPVRDKDRLSTSLPFKQNSSLQSQDLSDVELRSAGLKTALLLAEEKNQKNEHKVKNLEEELRKAYEKVIKLNNDKKNLEKKCNTLVTQLDKVMGTESAQTAFSRKEADPDIQILREVAANKRKKALHTLRNSWRQPLMGQRPIQRQVQSQSQRPIQRQIQSQRPIARDRGPKQKQLIFTNSNRKNQLIRDAVRQESRPSYLSTGVSQMGTSRPITRSVPDLGVRFDSGSMSRTQFEDALARTRSYASNYTSDFGSNYEPPVVNATRRYPPGILPAPSYLDTLGQSYRDRLQFPQRRQY